jgi:hypothetical protein
VRRPRPWQTRQGDWLAHAPNQPHTVYRVWSRYHPPWVWLSLSASVYQGARACSSHIVPSRKRTEKYSSLDQKCSPRRVGQTKCGGLTAPWGQYHQKQRTTIGTKAPPKSCFPVGLVTQVPAAIDTRALGPLQAVRLKRPYVSLVLHAWWARWWYQYCRSECNEAPVSPVHPPGARRPPGHGPDPQSRPSRRLGTSLLLCFALLCIASLRSRSLRFQVRRGAARRNATQGQGNARQGSPREC